MAIAHHPEMVQELSALQDAANADTELGVTFVPHLVPMTRGILATCYPSVADDALPTDVDERVGVLRETYSDYYADAPFVHVTETRPRRNRRWARTPACSTRRSIR